jgi:hypothetical protein
MGIEPVSRLGSFRSKTDWFIRGFLVLWQSLFFVHSYSAILITSRLLRFVGLCIGILVRLPSLSVVV